MHPSETPTLPVPHRIASRRVALWALLALIGLTAPLSAQTEPAAPAAEEDPAPLVAVAPERESARATMLTFLEAMNDVALGDEERLDDAIACLDLSDVSQVIRERTGTVTAVQLKEAIDRLEYVEASLIPDDPEAVAWTFVTRREGRVRIGPVPSGEWLFTRDTVRMAPTLYESVKELSRLGGIPIDVARFERSQVLRDLVPKDLQRVGLLLEHWQWLALLAMAFLGVVIDRLSVALLALLVAFVERRRGLQPQPLERIRGNLRPLGVLAMAGLWSSGLSWLGLPEQAFLWLVIAVEFVLAAASVWGAFRLVNLLGDVLTSWALRTESSLDDLLVPLIAKSLKVFIVVMGLVFLADMLQVELAPLLTGLGLGGLAFALAAKDMVGNVFGSVMVIADRTFKVGDWVVIGDVEGTIEQVGFRSTRVRTFYNSLITLPNSTLITTAVDNLGQRRYRRWRTMLSVTYDTPPGRIEAFCEGIRELIRRHPYTRKDYYQVYLSSFEAASLDVLVYMFFSTPDWSTELRERQRLMLDILRLARSLGVEFAFPTQTLHVRREDERPPEADDYMSQREVSQASMRGRARAREIMESFGLSESERPPPVRFDVAPEVDRGDDADG